MEKIPTLFARNYETDHRVRDEMTPGCEWVIAGEGRATRKIDGTACAVIGGNLYKRYDAKAGKPVPEGFIDAQDDPDAVTGHRPGWVPVDGAAKENRWHLEAWFALPVEDGKKLPDGTYELVGPKVQGNPEGYEKHALIAHGSETLDDVPRTFSGLLAYLAGRDIEGIVFWHPDGRMVKIKKRDFGLARKELVHA